MPIERLLVVKEYHGISPFGILAIDDDRTGAPMALEVDHAATRHETERRDEDVLNC